MRHEPRQEPRDTAVHGPPVIALRSVSLPGMAGTAGTRPPRARHVRHVRHHAPDAASTSGVNLTVRRGELALIGGPAGAGKSVLLHVLALLLRPAGGTYLLDGTDTARLRDRDLAALRGRQVGIAFQRPNLLPARSALENVMLPLLYAPAAGQRRRCLALDALDRVGMASRAGSAAWELSAGEQRRVAIARAIVARPPLLLCDDPTASLDSRAAAEVIGMLAAVHRDGVTMLIASRDQLAAAYASRLLTVGGEA